MKSLSQLIEPGKQLTVRRHQETMFGFSCTIRDVPECEPGPSILWEDAGHGTTVEAALDSFELVADGAPPACLSEAYLKVKTIKMDGQQIIALKELVEYAARNFIMSDQVDTLGELISEMQ